MKTIKDTKKLDAYIKKFHIDQYFTHFDDYYPYMSLVETPRRTFIISAEEYDKSIYFYVEGKFKVYGNQSNGKRILYRFCQAFMLLGDMEFLLGGQNRQDLSVEAVEKCVAVVLNFHEIRSKLENDPKFLYFLCQSMAEKFSYFGNMQMENSLQPADEKVAGYILHSIDTAGVFRENQRIAAEELNISYRHMHRILQKFVENGCIRRIEHGYLVTDKKALESYSLTK